MTKPNIFKANDSSIIVDKTCEFMLGDLSQVDRVPNDFDDEPWVRTKAKLSPRFRPFLPDQVKYPIILTEDNKKNIGIK